MRGIFVINLNQSMSFHDSPGSMNELIARAAP
jgi:hypothetical protein